MYQPGFPYTSKYQYWTSKDSARSGKFKSLQTYESKMTQSSYKHLNKYNPGVIPPPSDVLFWATTNTTRAGGGVCPNMGGVVIIQSSISSKNTFPLK